MNKYLLGIYDKRDFRKLTKPGIIFVGRSNVGKSSLINKLLKGNFAKVSQTPGKTKAIHIFLYNNLYLIDLPGYGYAKTSKEQIKTFDDLINSYLMFIKDSNVRAFVLIDAKVSLTKLDIMAIDYLKSINIEYIFIATKIDKINQKQRAKLDSDLSKYGNEIFYTSALKNKGYKELEDYIKEVCFNE